MIQPESFGNIAAVYSFEELRILADKFRAIESQVQENPRELLLDNLEEVIMTVSDISLRQERMQNKFMLKGRSESELAGQVKDEERQRGDGQVRELADLEEVVADLSEELEFEVPQSELRDEVGALLLAVVEKMRAIYGQSDHFREDEVLAREKMDLVERLREIEGEAAVDGGDEVYEQLEEAMFDYFRNLSVYARGLMHPIDEMYNKDISRYFMEVKKTKEEWLSDIYQFAADKQAFLTHEGRVLASGNLALFRKNAGILNDWASEYKAGLMAEVEASEDENLKSLWDEVESLLGVMGAKLKEMVALRNEDIEVFLQKNAVGGLHIQRMLRAKIEQCLKRREWLANQKQVKDETIIEALE
jgi:hypothetical protein